MISWNTRIIGNLKRCHSTFCVLTHSLSFLFMNLFIILKKLYQGLICFYIIYMSLVIQKYWQFIVDMKSISGRRSRKISDDHHHQLLQGYSPINNCCLDAVKITIENNLEVLKQNKMQTISTLALRSKTCLEKWSHNLNIILALPMLSLFSSKAQGCKHPWIQSKPCHVGIYWIVLAECSQMSTHLPWFQSFSGFLHHFVSVKLATSSIRVSIPICIYSIRLNTHSEVLCKDLWFCP